ncbi:hypothetical protein TNIN_178711 [Trichonephila inaurata madagascariensis]|uniref:Uncharacterized protein n=1 Tax=Trichonephila inaurata madagascariensis TaxID=2747483 RepID=A0A8X6IGS2_9ARAC|nr:hypothetical protein TNIN_178711 [Trichonephila inaurata madagascariensis]
MVFQIPSHGMLEVLLDPVELRDHWLKRRDWNGPPWSVVGGVHQRGVPVSDEVFCHGFSGDITVGLTPGHRVYDQCMSTEGEAINGGKVQLRGRAEILNGWSKKVDGAHGMPRGFASLAWNAHLPFTMSFNMDRQTKGLGWARARIPGGERLGKGKKTSKRSSSGTKAIFFSTDITEDFKSIYLKKGFLI